MSAGAVLISQFFVLSPRGDSIIFRDFRFDLPKGTAEVFFRNVKFWQGKQQDAPPVFRLDNVNYMYLKKNGLYLVCTTKYNTSPAFVIELLTRLTKLFKDYCGTLTEESIRTNFILIYELLDEVVDFGYIQNTQADQLKTFIFNEPIVPEKPKGIASIKIPDINSKTTPSTSVDKPITVHGKGQKNEIFVDIYERISITFNANGSILNQSIDGTIQMKSYLAGNPELKLALNEELVIGKTGTGAAVGSYGAVELDNANFHGCVKLDNFQSQRVLSFTPPDGEFVVMNYRMTSDFRPPFRIFPFFELLSPYKVEVIVKIRADIPEQNYGGNVVVAFPVPKNTNSATCDVGVGAVGQSAEYDAKQRQIVWKIKKFKGGSEQTLRTKVTLSAAHTNNVRKEIGPISMQFEIPMYNASNLQVRYLRIIENKDYNPYRWVRYVTRSQSYVCRL